MAMGLGHIILLVLCFSMMVSADPQNMLNTVHKKYVDKTARIMSSFLSTVADEIKAAKGRKFLVDSCHDDFVNSTRDDIDPVLTKMTACFTKNTNSRSAEACYERTLTELTKEAHDLHLSVKNCIKIKCAAKYFPRKCQ